MIMCVCKGCAFEYEWKQGDTSVPVECIGCQVMDGKPTNFKPKPMTNADRIRAMTDEEMAKWLVDMWDCTDCSEYERIGGHPLLSDEQCDQKCEQHCLQWLKQPAEEGE